MNQSVLGALRSVGYLILFAIIGAIISVIPDALTQLPYIGGLITPAISLGLTAYLAALEHKLATAWGYNLPTGTVAVPKSRYNS